MFVMFFSILSEQHEVSMFSLHNLIRIYRQRSHNLGKFPQIFPVFMGVVLGIMRILCIPFKILWFG